MDRFKTGINLGGWLSQFTDYNHEHFNNFITENDIKRIAGWGVDHVRLPVDYIILESDEKPFSYKDTGFSYIDRCLEWCEANGLNMVLDIHRAPGYSFDAKSGINILFDDNVSQQRLIALWETLIRRYGDRKKPEIIFELLNEIVLPSSSPWNNLAHKIHDAIRKINTDAWIMVGGNEWNAVNTLKEIDLFDDPRTIYTFHYYEPLPFTHQKAYWADELRLYDKEMAYPGKIDDLREFLDRYPQFEKRLGRFVGINMDEQFFWEDLQPAVDFLKNTGRPLYCGEFGVIDKAPRDSRLRWFRDFIKIMKKLDIGYACWSYKQMDFGLVNEDGKIVDEELIKIICMK